MFSYDCCCCTGSSEGKQPRCCYSAAMIVHVILKLLRSEGLVLSCLRLRQARTPLSSITFSISQAGREPSHREKKQRESALEKQLKGFALCQKVKVGYVSISRLAAAETNTAPSSHTGRQRHLAAVCRHGSAQDSSLLISFCFFAGAQEAAWSPSDRTWRLLTGRQAACFCEIHPLSP